MSFEGHYEERTSKENKPYKVLVIQTKDGKFKKDVYLKWAEIQLLEVLFEREEKEEEMPFLR